MRSRFIASFVSARGLQFLAPIAAANLLSRGDYGAIEFAYAAATIAIAVASLGTLNAVPFVMLRSLGSATLRAVILHLSGVVAISLIVALCAATLLGPLSAPVLAAVCTALFAVQGFWTYVLRARGAVALSLYLDALPFTVVSAAAAGAWIAAPTQALTAVATASVCVLVAGIWVTMASWPRLVPSEPEPLRYVATLRAGIPLMVGGLLALLATTSGRLGIGLWGNPDMTGTFAALSRIAALPIVAHQLAVVARFRDFYVIDPPELERLVVKVAGLVALSVGITLLALPWAGPWLGPAFHRAAQQHPLAANLLVAQVILWSAISLNDLIGARHEVLSRVIPWTGSLLAAAIAVAWWILTSAPVTVDRFAIWHTGVMLALFSAQSIALARLGVRFGRFWLFCLVAFGCAIVLPFWLTPSSH